MDHRPMIIPKKLMTVAALAGLMLAAGCGGDDASAPQEAQSATYKLEDTKYTRNIEVFSNVKRLDDRAAAVAQLSEKTVSFPASMADVIGVYKPGDIMATDAGEGLLRRVERVENRGDQIVVHTSEAALTEVFAAGEIYVAALAEEDLEVPKSFRAGTYQEVDGLRQTNQELGVSGGWDGELFSWDKDFAQQLNSKINNDHVIVEEASMAFSLGGEFYGAVEGGLIPPSIELSSLKIGANGQANTTLRVRLESDDEFSFSKEIPLLSTRDSNALYAMEPKSFSVANLVQIKFDTHSNLHLEASANGEISATGEVQVNGNLNGGIERKNGKWQRYYGGGLTPSGYGPDFAGDKSFKAQAKLTTELTVDVSNTLNGNLKIEPVIATMDASLKIDADSGACPYSFNVNLTGKGSGIVSSVGAFGINIDLMKTPYSRTLYNYDFLTKQGQLEFPGLCDPNYEPPEFGTEGRTEGMACEEESQCKNGHTCYRETCVREGPMRVSVAWFSNTDVDLALGVPSPDGGVEWVDWEYLGHWSENGFQYDFSRCHGDCSGDAPYVESIFSDTDPVPGEYLIRVVHEDDRLDGANPDFEVVVNHNGKEEYFGGKLTEPNAESPDGEGKPAVEFVYTVE